MTALQSTAAAPAARPGRFQAWQAAAAGIELLVVLAGMLLCAALGLVDGVTWLELVTLVVWGLLALVLTAALCHSRMVGWQVMLTGLAGGVIVSWLWLGRLVRPLGSLVLLTGQAVVQTVQAGWQLLGAAEPPGSPGGLRLDPEVWGAVQRAAAQLAGTTAAFNGRLLAWARAMGRGQAVFDPTVVNFVWGMAFWAAACLAVWLLLRRQNALAAALPAGFLLAGVLNYTAGRTWPLMAYTALALLLVALNGHSRRQAGWQAEGVDYAAELRLDLVFASAAAVLVVMLAAAGVSLVRFKGVAALARQGLPVDRDLPGASGLGLERAPGDGLPARPGGLPRRHLLGAGPELSQSVVMQVSVDEPAGLPDGYHPYWRGAAYDVYNGAGWEISATETQDYAAGEWTLAALGTTASGAAALSTAAQNGSTEPGAAQAPVVELRPELHILRQRVEPSRGAEAGSGWLYAAGALLSADHDFVAEWRRPPQSAAGEAGSADQTAQLLDGLLTGADLAATGVQAWPYSALSLVQIPSQEQLRSAGEAGSGGYPDWVSASYLELPASTPQRVRDLAQQLTAGQPTAYDKAAALQAYLRGFPYSLDVPAPPVGRDVADYFLFDLQRGYCDYYATAMAVLGRAAGLPTRLVMGYASGSYDAQSRSYQVTEADAHSWTEIYFPGYGWVEFEPTASRPAPALPERLTGPGRLTGLPALAGRQAGGGASWQLWGLFLLAAAMGCFGLWWGWQRRLERNLPDDLAI